ncbi:hypothetical protein SCUP234_10339 [Seiridium cupressi]
MAPHVSNVLETKRAEDPAASKERLLEAVKKANVWVVKNKPSLTQQELDTVVEGPEIDEHWTEVDEEQSVNDWHSDPMRKHMLDNKSNLSLGGPWRYAARFYGMTIEEIISPLYDLEYDASSHAKMYVVKCETNDQRVMRWPRTNWTTDKFFDVFAKVAKKQNGTRSMIEIHDERKPVVTDKDVGTYKINKRVLDKLTQALDAQKDRNGLPVYRNADFTCRAAEAARSSYDLPKSGDLEKIRDRILLTMRQESAKKANTVAAQASASAGHGTSPDPGQQADPEASTSPRLPGLTNGGFARFHLSNAYREAHYPDEGSIDEGFGLDEAIELRQRRNIFAEDLA